MRTKYLDKIDGQFSDFDMVMIVDMDFTLGWDMRGIYDTFSKIDNWQAICANGIFTQEGNLWDAFAFRNNEFPEGLEAQNYWDKIVPKVQKIYPVNTKLISVDSCFGGLAFYKRAYLKGCRYDSINGDCEHVAFHKCIKNKNGGKMFMNPSMILRYW